MALLSHSLKNTSKIPNNINVSADTASKDYIAFTVPYH